MWEQAEKNMLSVFYDYDWLYAQQCHHVNDQSALTKSF